MGSHSKKHKKYRRRSRSRSRSSEHRRHKSLRKSRSRSVSRSSSDSGWSDRRTKSKKHRRRSRSRSRSRSRGHRSRSRSRDRDKRSSRRGRRSRSRSVSRSRKRSRTRSRSPCRSHRRSRSRSGSAERSSHSGSHSRHDSMEKSKGRDSAAEKQPSTVTPAETVKQKMQKALEAAASANDKLKEKGVISSAAKPETLSMAEEREKQQTIAELEDDSFNPSTFLSGQSVPRKLPASLTQEQNHDNAIFGSAAVTVAGLNRASFKKNQTIFYKTVNRGELASSLLAKTSEEKMEAWVKKLTRMRQEKIQANPEYFKKLLTIGADADDSWRD